MRRPVYFRDISHHLHIANGSNGARIHAQDVLHGERLVAVESKLCERVGRGVDKRCGGYCVHAITLDLEREEDVERPSRQDAKVIAQNRESVPQNDAASLAK